MNIINYGKLLEIVEFSIDMVIFHSYVSHYQRVSTGNGTCMEMWNWITSMEGDHWRTQWNGEYGGTWWRKKAMGMMIPQWITIIGNCECLHWRTQWKGDMMKKTSGKSWNWMNLDQHCFHFPLRFDQIHRIWLQIGHGFTGGQPWRCWLCWGRPWPLYLGSFRALDDADFWCHAPMLPWPSRNVACQDAM